MMALAMLDAMMEDDREVEALIDMLIESGLSSVEICRGFWERGFAAGHMDGHACEAASQEAETVEIGTGGYL